jgi:hypothetical protein
VWQETWWRRSEDSEESEEVLCRRSEDSEESEEVLGTVQIEDGADRG